jgi:hypothetical protein
LWERVQRRLNGNVTDKQSVLGGNPGRKYLLTGLAQCPVCGRRLAGNSRNRSHGKCLFYVCGQNKECANRYKLYPGEVLNELTVNALTYLANHPKSVSDAIRAYDDHANSARKPEHEPAVLRAELVRVNKEIDTCRRAMIQAMQVGMREADFLTDLGRLARTREKIEQQIQALDGPAVRTDKESPATTAEKIAAVAESIVKVFDAQEDDFSTSDKQQLLSRIVESVKPIDDGAEVTLRSQSETVHCVHSKCFITTLLLYEEKR